MDHNLTGSWTIEKTGSVFTAIVAIVAGTRRKNGDHLVSREKLRSFKKNPRGIETIAYCTPYHSSMKLLFTDQRRYRRAQSVLSSLVLASTLLGISACNGENGGSDTRSFIEPDWIHDTGTDTGSSTAPTPAPAPTTTATPTPTPTPTTTTTPPPTPTTTPSPQPTGTAPLYTGPAEMAPYVDKFVADGLIQGIDVIPMMKNPGLTIQIASLDAYGSGVIGLCETGGNTRRVTFDPDFWNSVSETQRELVAHHEFGHCVLYRGHDNSLLSSGKYDSIMYPIIMSSATYTSNYDHYQEELYSTAK